ncbi:hypothetical protein X797_000235 [Metarhizium robertsii]|uniref:Uncharacterized protein n=2 Tax=Metarhizium robertsii TaxID=568076 RepID=E9EQD4_METRA|nr:uncharacterized protein MAA_01917 [Metarhizium robertsii ARSEF 23]EFZ02335.2 hypothetical protein MAA_01917 [Metarhizium robertsii ARSEF 23]EXV05520.1 hypothetical protein X797_000235 [Metarhizium robertsii]
MDVVIKIPLAVVFIYSWDYVAPYLTRSDFTSSTSPEGAIVRFFSWTGIYLTKVVVTFRRQFYQDLHESSNAVRIHEPKDESRPDVISADSKPQPLRLSIRRRTFSQPSRREVDEFVARSRLEECLQGSQYCLPVAAYFEPRAATPMDHIQSDNSRVSSKCERSKECLREQQRLEKSQKMEASENNEHDQFWRQKHQQDKANSEKQLELQSLKKPQQMEAPENNRHDRFCLQKHHQDNVSHHHINARPPAKAQPRIWGTSEPQNLENSKKQLQLADIKRNDTFRQLWENLKELLPPRQTRGQTRGQSREKFVQDLASFEKEFSQEEKRLKIALHRIEGKQFDNKESLAREQDKFAKELKHYANTLDKFREWLRGVYLENKSHRENLQKQRLQETLRKQQLQEALEKRRLQEILEEKLLQGNLQNKRRQEDLRKQVLEENLRKKLLQGNLWNRPRQEDQTSMGQHGREHQKTREDGKCGQQPVQLKSALKQTNARTYQKDPVGRDQIGHARMAGMERVTKATTTKAEGTRRKVYWELPMKDE